MHPLLRRVVCSIPSAILILVASSSIAAQPKPASALTCRELPGWPRLDAADSLGMVSGIALDPSGHVVVFRRAGRLWNSDTLDLTPNGVPGRDTAHFDMPSGVAVGEDGSFYVSDGYGNTRVLHFAPDGRLLRQWGGPGAGPGRFDLVHGVALGTDGRVYVADRENQRVQTFDAAGTYLAQWQSEALGTPYALAAGPAGTIWAGTVLVADGGRAGYFDDPNARSGVVVVDPDGTVQARFAELGRDALAPLRPHALAVGADGAVYVAGLRLAKFICR